MNWSLAIVAGGKSSRMGTDKAFVKLDSKPMIQHVIDRITGLGQSETILITNQPSAYEQFGLPIFTDVYPDKGSLGGIYTAITYAQHPYILVVACDMPFLNSNLLRFMVSQITEDIDIIAPRVEGYPQGLHAIYNKTCLLPIQERLDANRLKIIRFYDDVRVRYLDESAYETYDPDGLSFTNLNTPDELDDARQQLL